MGLIVYSLIYINLAPARSTLHISALYLNKEESIQFPSMANSAFPKSGLPLSEGPAVEAALQMFCWVLLLGDD